MVIINLKCFEELLLLPVIIYYSLHFQNIELAVNDKAKRWKDTLENLIILQITILKSIDLT